MNENSINKWAQTLIATHKNPLKKLELLGSKFFLPAGSTEEKEVVTNSLDIIAQALKSERAERRCARAVGNWLPEQKLAEVTKSTGVSNNFGFANKSGRFLYPEEAMFLLETNRLELFWNGTPLSIQHAYEVVLNNSTCSFSKYIAYKKLAVQGFRLVQVDHNDFKEPLPKKLRLSENEPSTSYTQTESELEGKSEELKMVTDIFQKLKDTGPKKFEVGTKQSGDYRIFLDGSSKACPNFNLYLSQSKQVDPHVGFLHDKAVLAYATSEFSGYVQFGRVDLPDL